MLNQEKLPRAWVYARIPGDCAAIRASYDACCRQAGDDGCTVVGGSIDYKGHGPLRDGYQSKSDWHSCYDRPSLSRTESHAGQ